MSNSATAEQLPLLEVVRALRTSIAAVLIGQSRAVDLALITLLSGGHALIEGVPGVGKTLLVRTLARCCAGEFQRVQFTPDLMPADITGTNVFDLRTQEFRVVRGPLFTQFLLADEINRAPAKTQSALLEAMQERQITIDRVSHALARTFTVFATENPIEHQGTYPLPEAQLDRFLFKIGMTPPAEHDELELAQRVRSGNTPERALEAIRTPVVSGEQLLHLQQQLNQIDIGEPVLAYAVRIVRETRTHAAVEAGAGPRATQAFIGASRAQAALDGRTFVIPEDVKSLALAILEHRLVLRPEFELERVSAAEVVAAVLERVEVPR